MPEQGSILFCIDMGTTRTRVWLTVGNLVLAHGAADFGARNSAAHFDRQWLSARLCGLMDEVVQSAGSDIPFPRYALAAGMITSEQGLLEVPHVNAPAGAKELAAGARAVRIAERNDTVLILMPGIRTGGRQVASEDISNIDLMRGEETLCIGLQERGELTGRMSLLNLGSHWKWISVNDEGRITGSWTTLTGEMIHAVQSNTLLAASVRAGRPETFDLEWMRRGLNEARAEGLARALFCVRLLHQNGCGTPQERLSYLYGAFLAEEIESAKKHCSLYGEKVLITGPSALATLWGECLKSISISATVLEDRTREAAYLNGLHILAKNSGLLI